MNRTDQKKTAIIEKATPEALQALGKISEV